MSKDTTTLTRGSGRRLDAGFTIVEMAIVIVVIGILAAITVVAYNGYQVRNGTFVLASDLQGAATQLTADKVHTGLYPSSAAASDGNRGLNASKGTSFTYVHVASDNSYCLTATSSRRGVPSHMISSNSTTPIEGVCPGSSGGTGPVSSLPDTSENCFRTSGNTITEYYANEGNNSRNAACPRDVIIPATIRGSAVYTIGNQAMRRDSLTSVVIPTSVTSIESEAFHENDITSLTIPNSVITFGVGAFRENLLTSVTLPNAMVSIGQEAFRENKLTSVVIPGSVTSIGMGAFRENNITSVSVPGSVASIGSDAFRDNRLSSVSIPTGATIGSGGFDSGVTITRF